MSIRSPAGISGESVAHRGLNVTSKIHIRLTINRLAKRLFCTDFRNAYTHKGCV